MGPDRVASALPAPGRWRPWPRAVDRGPWEALPERLRARLLADAEAAAAAAWPRLPATLWMQFARDGERAAGEEVHFTRRRLLRDLVLGACVAGDDRFTDAVVDAVWSVCEESSWTVPAHAASRRHCSGRQGETPLPDEDDPVVDLFAAETGAQLAWTHHLLGAALARAAPAVPERVVREVRRRLLVPFVVRDDWHWLGVGATHAANWTPWVCSNLVLCSLLLEDDVDARARQVSRAVAGLDVYVASMPEDGGCSEGQAYWARGPGSLLDALEALHDASGGALDGFVVPRVRAATRYPPVVHVDGRWFAQHADGHVQALWDPVVLHRYARRVGDPVAEQLAVHLRDAPAVRREASTVSLTRALPDVLDVAWREAPAEPAPALPDAWLPDLQVMSARAHAGSTRGLTLVAKGGSNGEDHNHDDVGGVVVALDGVPVVVDPGVEAYRRETFGQDRSSIWTMRSGWHGVPVVDGAEQGTGAEHAARDVRHHAGGPDGASRLRLELAGTWPRGAGVRRWVREVALERRDERVVLADEWELDVDPGSLVLPLVVAGPPEPAEDGVVVAVRGARLRVLAPGMRVQVEERPLTDPWLRPVWGPALWRVLLSPAAPARTGRWEVVLRAAP